MSFSSLSLHASEQLEISQGPSGEWTPLVEGEVYIANKCAICTTLRYTAPDLEEPVTCTFVGPDVRWPVQQYRNGRLVIIKGATTEAKLQIRVTFRGEETTFPYPGYLSWW